ncbi:MAG TPA: type II secretion system F family protein [Candidatus Limnocylindrales bacterium]|nr:type II secretion system F family protein [Candidatus Limnocylindrales bacterium]
MPFIVTPRQLDQRAELFHQLAQLTSAGIGIIAALEQIKRGPPSRSYREPLQRLLDELARGATVADALHRLGWLPAFDLALIEAGERSGRIDACSHLLADYYNERARLIRQTIADLIYPVSVFHLAVFVSTLLEFLWSGPWLLVLFGGLIPLYAATAFLIYAAQDRHNEAWRTKVESVLRFIPVLGTARHYLALSRLAAALEALISAGVNIFEAWELAAAASGSPALRRAVADWRPKMTAGQMPSEAVRACRLFPEMFANFYASGEVSGKLDESLRHLNRLYSEEGLRKLHLVSKWVPRFIYFMVVLFVGYIVIRFWTNYFNQLNQLSHF